MKNVMKRMWIPLVLAIGMGLLAGLVNIFDLTIMSPTGWPIGFYNIFLFFAVAIGGPVGGLSEIIMISMINSFGPLGWRDMIGPELYWANVITEGLILLPLFALGYRLIFKRVKMPLRLLTWIGLIIGFYLLDVVILPLLWWLFEGMAIDASFVENIVSGIQSWLPQMITDIIISCLIMLALPERFRRPLWIDSRATTQPAEEKA